MKEAVCINCGWHFEKLDKSKAKYCCRKCADDVRNVVKRVKSSRPETSGKGRSYDGM
jgi:protein-arginine kinase activator protein McsA